MRILTLINGSLLSEAASKLAVFYAAQVKLPLTAIFVDNGRESVSRASASAKALEKLAEQHEVQFEYLPLEGEVITQLEHYCQLYAIDTLFCATRHQSDARFFSEQIVEAKIETDVAVVKIKSIGQLESCQQVMLVSNEQINAHAYVLWLGLIKHWQTSGLLYLSQQSTFLNAHTHSGIKYQTAPFMQIATLSGCDSDRIEAVNTLQPMSVEQMLHYQIEKSVNLAIYTEGSYSAKSLRKLGESSGVNSIIFYPWIS